jgi:hypothetical protein
MLESVINVDDVPGEIVPPSKSACSSTMPTSTSAESSSTPEKTTTAASTTPPSTPEPVSTTKPSNSKTPKASAPSKIKFRRQVAVEESIDNAVSVQRLVEYFLVISCRPRWENNYGTRNQQSGTNMGDGAAGAATTSTSSPRKEGISPKKLGRSLNNEDNDNDGSKNHTKTGTDHALNHTLSLDHVHGEDEWREAPSLLKEDTTTTLPPPKPRETWNRDEGVEENIRDPGTAAESGTEYSHSFAPKVTARFPLEDHSDHPVNPMVTQFCFPEGDLIYPSTEYSMPCAHHFVMTNDKGRKVYGTCLTIYEEYHPPENTPWAQSPENLYPTTVGETGIEVSVNSQGNRLYIPRCLCILSIWPYVTAFREYLAQLYRLATSTDCMKAPIERYVMNLCMEIPAPPPGSFEVKISILDSVIRFWSPPAKLPIAYVALPYQTLFDCLDIENILHLWYCLTMERKVLLVSSQNSILTVCSEILCSLLYPMKWSHLYVPLLPKFLCPILDAPGTLLY